MSEFIFEWEDNQIVSFYEIFQLVCNCSSGEVTRPNSVVNFAISFPFAYPLLVIVRLSTDAGVIDTERKSKLLPGLKSLLPVAHVPKKVPLFLK